MADLSPVTGVLPFEPITPLFSDYAHKSRFVWMPDGVSASYVADSLVLDFPDGAVLIKNFYYDHVQPADTRRIMETRLLYRRDDQWQFATYVWNAAQTEATLRMDGQNEAVQWVDDGGTLRNVNYRIPSLAECQTCHKKYGLSVPIGVKPQNLNSNFGYTDGAMNQLAKWQASDYLQGGLPASIETVAKWDDVTLDPLIRVRAYVDMNCSHCHSQGGHCDYRPMRFAWHDSNILENLGVCVPPDDNLGLPQYTHIVNAGNIERSMMYFRMSSADEAVRMPLLGRTLVHDEAVQLIGDWITSLTPPCP